MKLRWDRLLQERGIHEGVDHGQENGRVPRVLVECPVARHALFAQLLQLWNGRRQQRLDDNRRADVRHDPEREDGRLRQRPPGEHIQQVEQPTTAGLRDLVEDATQLFPIDPRGRDKNPHLVEGQHREREEQFAS